MKQASQPGNYRIIIEGALDPIWCDCLGGLSMTVLQQPGQSLVTQLEGQLVDQSALQGVLDTLFMLGMRLVSVERVQPAP